MIQAAQICFGSGLIFVGLAVWLGVEIYYRKAGTDTAATACMAAAVAVCFFIAAAGTAATGGAA